jgi:hypothetical protein
VDDAFERAVVIDPRHVEALLEVVQVDLVDLGEKLVQPSDLLFDATRSWCLHVRPPPR